MYTLWLPRKPGMSSLLKVVVSCMNVLSWQKHHVHAPGCRTPTTREKDYIYRGSARRVFSRWNGDCTCSLCVHGYRSLQVSVGLSMQGKMSTAHSNLCLNFKCLFNLAPMCHKHLNLAPMCHKHLLAVMNWNMYDGLIGTFVCRRAQITVSTANKQAIQPNP